MSRSATSDGHRRVPPPLRGAVPGVPLHRLERAAQPAPRANGARGAGPARHRRDGAGRVGPRGPARLLGLRGGGPTPGPDRALGPGPAEGSLVTIDVGPTPSCGGWSDGSWRPSWRSVAGRWTRRRSGRQAAAGSRPSTGQPPRRRALPPARRPRTAADRGRRTERQETRGTMNDEDLHGARERDRATLVRRGCDGRDARPPRDADRARPRGQAQADLVARTSTPATT